MPDADLYRFDLLERGYPPMAGGAPEEDEPGEPEGTPETSPEGEEGQGPETPPEQTDDWKSQYDELRSDYTRKTQRLSETERLIGQLQSRNPDQQAEALEALGLLEQEAQDDPFEDDPQAAVEARLAALEAEREAEAQERQAHEALQQEVQYLEQHLGQLEEKLGRKLSDEEVRLYGYVASNIRTEENQPDVAGAHRLIEDLTKQRIEEWRRSKQVPQVQTGTAGKKEIDFSDPEARARYMAQRVQAERAAQG